jgi:hypothetical protein
LDWMRRRSCSVPTTSVMRCLPSAAGVETYRETVCPPDRKLGGSSGGGGEVVVGEGGGEFAVEESGLGDELGVPEALPGAERETDLGGAGRCEGLSGRLGDLSGSCEG